MIYRNAGVVEDLSAYFQRCSACGHMNRIDRVVGGGPYVPSSTVTYTDPVTGKNFYSDAAASNGCVFCGSPAWMGPGNLGDCRTFKHS